VLIIVRHGRTEANAAARLLGRLDLPLDDLGERQAARLAASLLSSTSHIDRVVSSPLQRTRQTAAHLGLPVEIDERFVEVDYGEYDGMPLADIPPDLWAAWRSDPDFTPPGGESLATLQRRVSAALDDLAEAARDQTIVVATHVSPIKASVAWALGVGDEVTWRLFVQPASITRIIVRDSGPVLQSFNETNHLEA
jgi:broad specificity phosphatase PhoE